MTAINWTICPRCFGTGYRGRWERGKWKIHSCPRCGGRGQVPEKPKRENKP